MIHSLRGLRVVFFLFCFFFFCFFFPVARGLVVDLEQSLLYGEVTRMNQNNK